MSAAAEIVRSLSDFTDRGVGTDAERRAAVWLAEEIRRPGRRAAELETFWSRPNWAMAQAWHIGLGLAGSLVSVASPSVGAGLLAAALLSVVSDATFGISPGRRLTPEHASQNVVSPPPARSTPDPHVRLIVTANLDAGRQGLAYRTALRQPFARLRLATGGRAPGWIGWLAIALAWTLITALLRATGTQGTLVKVLQLIPSVGLVIALAVLLELAGAAWAPGAGDNASGVAVAIALARALDAAPPAHAAVELLVTGAGDGQNLGLRHYLRARRHGVRPANTVVMGIGPCGGGGLASLRSDGPLIPVACSAPLRQLCAQVAGEDPRLGLATWRSRGTSPTLAARYRGLPAVTITARDPDGLVPRSHQAADTADQLDDEVLERTLLAGLALADAIDAYLGTVRPG
jgi:hypothetical protein